MPLQILTFNADRSFSKPVLGGQIGDRVDLVVSATPNNTNPATRQVICRLVAGENCYVRIGKDATASGAHSELWLANDTDDRIIAVGERISVVTA